MTRAGIPAITETSKRTNQDKKSLPEITAEISSAEFTTAIAPYSEEDEDFPPPIPPITKSKNTSENRGIKGGKSWNNPVANIGTASRKPRITQFLCKIASLFLRVKILVGNFGSKLLHVLICV